MEKLNLFECSYCKKQYWYLADKIFICPICKSRDTITKIDVELQKPKILDVLANLKLLQELSNKELISFHHRLHRIYHILRRRRHKRLTLKKRGVRVRLYPTSIEGVVDTHLHTVVEMERRSLKYAIKDRLNRETEKLKRKKFRTSKPALKIKARRIVRWRIRRFSKSKNKV